ncbi:aromatic ring-hydroxylating dioxygenase subunit alpha [Salipiger sp. IMCC34102]|uniref:aromatic ring-hydroxylating oxygenase subunit alpha n=1 Tax=Salipiger sp. IMCC34102 TaxID=2510647 RepID=UPI00101D53CA|nr:aromatic ring-hydroxylating dioxygenase subunit alpha [Salipiger sp. IMCC34102]RYH02551.1 aromatic ring-hydroxylating dioxygenase subunit alpha [Salipiger sp. IMCC34102]
MLRDSDVLSTLMQRKPAYSLAQDLYCDPGVFKADMNHIWYKEWVFAIASCEIPKTGNYVVHDIGAYSVVIVRGSDGEIRAFHNSCRHRGSVLCKAKKGTGPKLVCPYHQWTYELDGRLLWARDMGPDFDASQHGLSRVHCRNLSGMVYICLAEEAPEIDAFAERTAAYLAPHDLENSKVAYESTIVEQGNWKLVWENNRECYHCAGNHPSLCRTFPEDPRYIGSDGELNDLQQQHTARCEAVGAPSAFLESGPGDWRYVRTPLLDGAESYTLDGKVASTRPNSTLPFRDAGALLKYKYPGCWNHFLSDHVILFRVTPISPMETEVCTKWLVHKDAVEGQDYDLQRLTEVWVATNSEDREVVENNQRGILSPAYRPGPYSPLHEGGLIQFTDWYASTMIAAMTGRSAAIAAE